MAPAHAPVRSADTLDHVADRDGLCRDPRAVVDAIVAAHARASCRQRRRDPATSIMDARLPRLDAGCGSACRRETRLASEAEFDRVADLLLARGRVAMSAAAMATCISATSS
jgi:hypothetical protein